MNMLLMTVLLGVLFVVLMMAKSPLAIAICFAPIILPFIARNQDRRKQQELIDAVRDSKKP